MAVVTAKGSRIITGLAASPTVLADPGEGGGKVRYWCETVEVTATDSASSTYELARIPSNARILGWASRIAWDDLASAACTGVVGVFNINSSRTDFTDYASALTTTALDLASANTGATLITDIANYGKRLWEFTTSTTNPNCDIAIKLKLLADVTAAGTVTVEILYTTD